MEALSSPEGNHTMEGLSMSERLGNSTTDTSVAPSLETLTIITVTVSILVLNIGSIGNTLVLVVFGRRWKQLKNCEIFMLNLAIADLIGSLVIPLELIGELLHYDMRALGDVGCRLISFLAVSSITVSSFTLVIISIDRFVIVRWQFRTCLERNTLILINIAVWVVCSPFGTIYLVSSWVKLHKLPDDTCACRNFASSSDIRIHFLVTFSFQVAVPLLVIGVLYSLIIQVLQTNTTNTLLKHSSREYRKRARSNSKAIRLLLFIVVAFFVCRLPVNIFYFVIQFSATQLPRNVAIRTYYILHMVEITSSCINPLIYSKMHTKFRMYAAKSCHHWRMWLLGKLTVPNNDIMTGGGGVGGMRSLHAEETRAQAPVPCIPMHIRWTCGTTVLNSPTGTRINCSTITAINRTPAGTPTNRTPAGTPTNRTPAGTPTNRTPAGTPTNRTPTGTPTNHTPPGTPTHRTPTGTPTHRTPTATPTHRTPTATPTHRTPTGTPIHCTST